LRKPMWEIHGACGRGQSLARSNQNMIPSLP
jgi:hypothetical protein